MMTIKHLRVRRNEVFVTNSDFLIPISSQLNFVDHRSNNLSLKYQGFPPSDCQDIRIRNFVFCRINSTTFLQNYFSPPSFEHKKTLKNVFVV